ncbi:YaeQ family protein [soil metagenome]
MASGATIHRVTIGLSDVDRGVYETLDLRLARHPSESLRFLVTRMLGYALSYQDGIAFSKGGISDTDDPPIAVHDPTGILLHWIDVGAPAVERIHKASKAARKVTIFTTNELATLRERAGEIHRAAAIEVVTLPLKLTDALEAKLDRTTKLDIARTEGELYITVGDDTLEATLKTDTL